MTPRKSAKRNVCDNHLENTDESRDQKGARKNTDASRDQQELATEVTSKKL